MQTALVSSGIRAPLAIRSPALRTRRCRTQVQVRAAEKAQAVQPINGDPYIGMLETPVTSSPVVAGLLSNLPAYRTGVSPLLRGVEIGLAHGYWIPGPFTDLGPLRGVPGVAEKVGTADGAFIVLLLTLGLTIYGAATFQQDTPTLGKKTLSGRTLSADPLQTSEGWTSFTSGFLVGGLAGVGWFYIMSQTLPYYQ